MEATLTPNALRNITRAISCLANYSDELSISASGRELALAGTNSSKTAFGRVTFGWAFFEKYDVTVSSNVATGMTDTQANEDVVVRVSVNLKYLLAILKQKSVHDSVEKCDLIIVGPTSGPDDDADTSQHIETKLIVRYHCKAGIVKTHFMPVHVPEDDLAPNVPLNVPDTTAKIVVGPGVIKGFFEHFGAGGAKADPQLFWEFGVVDVKVKSVGTGSKADGSLLSEINIESAEFSEYVVPQTPVSMMFQWREFDASTSLAESLERDITIYFTQPGQPLWMEVESNQQRAVFVISTAPTSGAPPNPAVQVQPRAATTTGRNTPAVAGPSNLGKRPRIPEAGPSSNNVRKRVASEGPDVSRQQQPVASGSGTRNRSNTPVGGGRPVEEEEYAGMDMNMNVNMNMDLDMDNGYNDPGPSKRRPSPPPSSSSNSRSRTPIPPSKSRQKQPAVSTSTSSSRPLFLPSQEPPSSSLSHNRPPIPEADFPSFGEGTSFNPAGASTPFNPRRPQAPNARVQYPQATQATQAPPILSQTLNADTLEQIREGGMRIEDLNAEQLDELMGDYDEDEDDDDDDDEFRAPPPPQPPPRQPPAQTRNGNAGGSSAGVGTASGSGRPRRAVQRRIVDDDDEEGDDDGGGGGTESFVPATQAAPVARRDGKDFQRIFD